MHWYMDVLKKYAEFDGRARRTEYWMFFLFHFVISLVLVALEVGLVGGPGVLFTLYSLAVLIPSLAVLVRRLHDTSRSAWWILVGFIPAVGGLVLLVLTVLPGTPGENAYGPNPKEMPVPPVA